MKPVTKAAPTGKHGKTDKIAKGPTGIERQRPTAAAMAKLPKPRSKVEDGLRAAIKDNAKTEPVRRPNKIVAGLKEAVDVAKGKRKPARVTAIPQSYEGRDPDKRRAYMVDLMRKRRAANKVKTRKGKRK